MKSQYDRLDLGETNRCKFFSKNKFLHKDFNLNLMKNHVALNIPK